MHEENANLVYYLFGHGEGGQFVNTFALFLYPLLDKEHRPVRMIVGNVGTAIFPGPPIMRESAIKINRSKCYTGPNCDLTSYPYGTDSESACPCHTKSQCCKCSTTDMEKNCPKCFIKCGLTHNSCSDHGEQNHCFLAEKQIKCSQFITNNNTAILNKNYDYPRNPFVLMISLVLNYLIQKYCHFHMD